MFSESLAWLTAKAASGARRLGYVKEAVAIQARYARCAQDWSSHLDNSKRFILRSLRDLPQRRIAVVLGAGQCLDLPLQELSQQFQRVILVDVVLLASTRRYLRRFSNVEYRLLDVTGLNEKLITMTSMVQAEALLQSQSSVSFLHDPEIDWIASVNLLSQLPLLPMKFLMRFPDADEQRINQFGLQMMRAHVEYLQAFQARRVMLFDAAMWQQNRQGERREEVHLLAWLQPPSYLSLSDHWLWTVAPHHESGQWANVHQVKAWCSDVQIAD